MLKENISHGDSKLDNILISINKLDRYLIKFSFTQINLSNNQIENLI